jgi:putative selenate reductase
VEACADGRRAAEAILAKLGIPARVPVCVRDRGTEEEITGVKRARARKEPPRHPALLPPERRGGFDLVELPLTEEEARREAARCLQCSSFCDKCVDVCPNRANYSYRVAPSEMTLPVLSCKDGRLVRAGEEPFRIRDGRQIVHLDDFCNECGNCATFCVHQGKPSLEKPRLFLEESDFLKERDNAFFIRGSEIRRREKGKESRLAVRNGTVEFESDAIRLRLSDRFDIKEMTLKTPFDGTFSLREAAEMKTLLDGVSKSAAFLVP